MSVTSTATCSKPSADRDGLGANGAFVRRNHRLGVLAGVFASMAQRFLQPELILGGLVWRLTGSVTAAAAVPVINKAGVFVPQLVVSTRLEHLPLRRPAFIAITVLRSVSLAMLVGSMAFLTVRRDALGLAFFFLAYAMTSLSTGAAHVIFMDMVGRLIPPGRVGSFLGMRTFTGGLIAFAVSLLIIQPVVSSEEHFPTNYVFLAAAGLVLVVIDMSTWSLCREEPGVKADRPGTLRETIGRGFHWLRTDSDYRWYFVLRIVFRINYMFLVFFIPYGDRLVRGLGFGGLAVLAGLLTAVREVSMIASSFVWGGVADRRGSRAVILGSHVLIALAGAMALAAPRLASVFRLSVRGLPVDLDLPLCIYMAALGLYCAGLRGTALGGQRFLITCAPPHRRGSYLAFVNTIAAPLTLLPLVVAPLAGVVGLSVIYLAVLVSSAVGIYASARMDPHRA